MCSLATNEKPGRNWADSRPGIKQRHSTIYLHLSVMIFHDFGHQLTSSYALTRKLHHTLPKTMQLLAKGKCQLDSDLGYEFGKLCTVQHSFHCVVSWQFLFRCTLPNSGCRSSNLLDAGMVSANGWLNWWFESWILDVLVHHLEEKKSWLVALLWTCSTWCCYLTQILKLGKCENMPFCNALKFPCWLTLLIVWQCFIMAWRAGWNPSFVL